MRCVGACCCLLFRQLLCSWVFWAALCAPLGPAALCASPALLPVRILGPSPLCSLPLSSSAMQLHSFRRCALPSLLACRVQVSAAPLHALLPLPEVQSPPDLPLSPCALS